MVKDCMWKISAAITIICLNNEPAFHFTTQPVHEDDHVQVVER